MLKRTMKIIKDNKQATELLIEILFTLTEQVKINSIKISILEGA